jgi:hypothetical protein
MRDSNGSRKIPVNGFFEHDNDIPIFIRDGEIFWAAEQVSATKEGLCLWS